MTYTRLQTLLACATVALVLVLTLLVHKSQASQQLAFELCARKDSSHFTTAEPIKFQNYSQIGQGVRCTGAGVSGGGVGPNEPYMFEQMK